jgi:hypothetical protein
VNCSSAAASLGLLPCSRKEFEALKEALTIEGEPYDAASVDPDDEDGQQHGFELDYDAGSPEAERVGLAGAFLYNDEDGPFEPFMLPTTFLELVAKILCKLERRAWRVGVAQTSSKTRCSSYGGYYFEITDAARVRMENNIQADWGKHTATWYSSEQVLAGVTFDLWALAVVPDDDGENWHAECPDDQDDVEAVLKMTCALSEAETGEGLIEMDGKKWVIGLFPSGHPKRLGAL